MANKIMASKMTYTEMMPWDKDLDELEEKYQRLFPESKRRFTFSEVRKKFNKAKKTTQAGNKK